MSARKFVSIKLTPKQAAHVWGNADGWLDAGACAGGMTKAESRAVSSLCDQILAQTHGKNNAEAGFAENLREQILDALSESGFAWHSDDERKIIGAIMGVLTGAPTTPSRTGDAS